MRFTFYLLLNHCPYVGLLRAFPPFVREHSLLSPVHKFFKMEVKVFRGIWGVGKIKDYGP